MPRPTDRTGERDQYSDDGSQKEYDEVIADEWISELCTHIDVTGTNTDDDESTPRRRTNLPKSRGGMHGAFTCSWSLVKSLTLS